MKDESQQQVPPGIVAFRSPAGAMIVRQNDVSQNYYKDKYTEWVQYMQSGQVWSIHTISVDGSVDGKDVSLGDITPRGNIFELKYEFGEWYYGVKDDTGCTFAPVRYLQSIQQPPPSQQDRSVSQPGKPNYAMDAILLIKGILHDDVETVLGPLVNDAINKALKHGK